MLEQQKITAVYNRNYPYSSPTASRLQKMHQFVHQVKNAEYNQCDGSGLICITVIVCFAALTVTFLRTY